MRRQLSTVVVGLLAVLGVAPAPAVARSAPPSVLLAGQQLVALTGHDRLTSPSGEFVLVVAPDLLVLDQLAQLDGPRGPDSIETGLWFRDDEGRHQSNRDHSILRLRRNGNLTLTTAGGTLLWASHTRGTGTRLLLGDGGNLVLRTSSGAAIWQTRTTPVYLAAGEKLRSGSRLVSRWGSQQDRTPRVLSLSMQRDGNLVYRCNSKVYWSTNTHVPGAWLAMQKGGDLVVRGPAGRLLWSTHTSGAGSYTYFDAISLEVDKLLRSRPIWHVALPYPLSC